MGTIAMQNLPEPVDQVAPIRREGITDRAGIASGEGELPPRKVDHGHRLRSPRPPWAAHVCSVQAMVAARRLPGFHNLPPSRSPAVVAVVACNSPGCPPPYWCLADRSGMSVMPIIGSAGDGTTKPRGRDVLVAAPRKRSRVIPVQSSGGGAQAPSADDHGARASQSLRPPRFWRELRALSCSSDEGVGWNQGRRVSLTVMAGGVD